MVFPSIEEAAYYRVKKLKGHNCSLNQEGDTVTNHINSGIFIPLRRYIRKSVTISARDPRTKAYAKSLNRILNEEKRHLEHYYYMIHPFSDFHFLWQTIMTIVHLTALTVLPMFYMARVNKRDTPIAPVTYSICMICLINIVLSFLIGFYDKTNDRVILKPKRVIIRYLITYFVFDLVSSVNYNVIAKTTGLLAPNWYSRLQWSLKLVRLFTMNDYLDNVQLRLGMPNYLFRGLKYVIFATVMIAWINFFTYSFDYYNDRQIVYTELPHKLFLVSIKNFRLLFQCDLFTGYHEYIEKKDLYLSLAVLHFGRFFEIWLLAQLFQVFSSHMIVTQKSQTMFHQIEAFTRFKDLPKRMCRRIYSYLNFRFQCLIFNEKNLIDNLCLTLKDEILWHKCQNLVTKVQTFRELPSSIMMKLATMLKPEIYLPNDVVVHTGEVGSEMFFVYVGVLAVFTESGKEICHLSDGTHFGEIALLLNEPRVASVVAIDFCELYRLTKRDFHEAIEPYPLVKQNILQAAQDRFRETRIITQK